MSVVDQPEPSAVWTGRGRDLRTLFEAVVVHAATESLPSVLDYVFIEVTGGSVYLAATDRYTLGVTRDDITHAGGDITVWVSADALRTAVARATTGRDVTACISVQGLTLQYQPLCARDAAESVSHQIPAEPIGVALPWRRLIGTAVHTPLDAEETATAVNPDFLDRFRAAGDGEPVLIHGTGRADCPVVVTCGDHFIGLIMPLRHGPEQRTGALGEWRSICPSPDQMVSDVAAGGAA